MELTEHVAVRMTPDDRRILRELEARSDRSASSVLRRLLRLAVVEPFDVMLDRKSLERDSLVAG